MFIIVLVLYWYWHNNLARANLRASIYNPRTDAFVVYDPLSPLRSSRIIASDIRLNARGDTVVLSPMPGLEEEAFVRSLKELIEVD